MPNVIVAGFKSTITSEQKIQHDRHLICIHVIEQQVFFMISSHYVCIQRGDSHDTLRYISLKGLKLEGADAYKAFEEDKAKLRSNGGRRVMDGSTILRCET